MKSPAPKSIHIVLADDHELVRTGIKGLLAKIDGVDVIAEAQDGRELVDLLAAVKPDLVVTDIEMPGIDGLAAIAEIHGTYPDVKILVLSMHENIDIVKRAIANGASGYLLKTAPSFELEQAVLSVLETGRYFSPSITSQLLQPAEPAPEDHLTQRQLEILVLLAQGMSSKEIGFKLGLSPKTIDVHRAHIMERLGVGDIANLTRYAVRKGLVSP